MSSMSRIAILKQAKHLVLSHIKHIPAKVYLFGSWARAEEKRSSDIDLAIEFNTTEASNLQTLINIRHALEESTIPYRFDLVYFNEADEYIIKKVREEGLLWDD